MPTTVPINAPTIGNKCIFFAIILKSVFTDLGAGIIVKNDSGESILSESKEKIPPSN